MKTIKVHKWKATGFEGTEVEENTIKLLSVLMSNADPKELPRGIDNFRLFHRISVAFDEAEKTGTLSLEENDYSVLKKIIEKDIPAIWGMNNERSVAVDEFVNAK